MKSLRILSLISLLSLLSGCFATADLKSQRELHKSLEPDTQISAGPLSAKTPIARLLNESTQQAIRLRGIDLGIGKPSTFSASAATMDQFMEVMNNDQKKAALVKEYSLTVKGTPTKVYLARFNSENSGPIKLIYSAYLEISGKGVAAEHVWNISPTALADVSNWDRIPPAFAAFLESLDYVQ
jgi:hypothetical protein